MNTFQQVAEIARPQMTHYFNDLEIDRDAIERYPGVPFIHATMPTGTYLLHLHPADSPVWPANDNPVRYLFGYARRWDIVEALAGTIGYLRRAYCGNHSYLFFDGSRIRKIDESEAIRLAEAWKESIRVNWFPY